MLAASTSDRTLPLPAEGSAGNSLETTKSVTNRHIESLIESVRQHTGIADNHLAPLQQLAKRENCIIGFRPVETVATSLIKDGAPTKSLHIKGKSADWGPQAGFICRNQALSKAAGKVDQINRLNALVEESIKDGHADAIPLTISKSRIHELFSMGCIHTCCGQDRIRIEVQRPDKSTVAFAGILEADSRYSIWHDGKPLEVLAPPGKISGLTADYDLLLVGPHLASYGEKDSLPPDLSPDHFKTRIEKNYPNLLNNEQHRSPVLEMYRNPTMLPKTDPDVGVVTQRTRELIPLINSALGREQGCELVHHGADSLNPATEQASNYPATFFLPQKIGGFEPICVIRNTQELISLFSAAKTEGYQLHANPHWDHELTRHRRASFDQARQELAPQISQFLSSRSLSMPPDHWSNRTSSQNLATPNTTTHEIQENETDDSLAHRRSPTEIKRGAESSANIGVMGTASAIFRRIASIIFRT